MEDIISIANEKAWVSAPAIDGYLALLCHYGNGHFGSQVAASDRPGTPRFHAWPIMTARWLDDHRGESGTNWTDFWPPQHYPDAVIAQVSTQFIPLHVGEGHWPLLEANAETCRIFSTVADLPGESRTLIEALIAVFSLPANVHYPNSQLQGSFDGGSGIIVMAQARYIMER